MSVASLFFIFAGLVVIEVPIAFALIAATMTFLTIASPLPLTIVAQRMVSGLDSFPLLAMPLFILAGNLMNRAGLASRIFAFALSLLGHIRGSLAHVNIGSSIIFAGMSGVAQADAAGLGTVEVRAMRKAGFDPAFAAAVTAASSIIGPIIPPSVIMVIYAVIAQVSVSDLFLAGILPGLLMGGFMMLMVWVLAVTGRIHAPVRPKATAREVGGTFMAALPSLLAPVILIAGLLSGAATPTELGALTVVYAIGVGFVQGELTLEGLRRAVIETGVTAGVLIFIIAAAIPFGWVVSINNLPAQLATTLLGLSNDPNVILLLVNLILLVAGLVMETTAILLIAVPALLPLALALNIDLVHFGVVVVLNLLIGATTPPFGVLLFIMMDIAKVSLGRLVIAMLPFYVALLGALLVVTFWPSFVLFLPNLLGR
jgi:tripartite ATP-independent transporter DctM subunit